MRNKIAGILLAAAIIPVFGLAQTEHPLTGRKIAPVMGAAGADWLTRQERESEEHPDQAIEELHLKPGMVVGDVGEVPGHDELGLADDDERRPECVGRLGDGPGRLGEAAV